MLIHCFKILLTFFLLNEPFSFLIHHYFSFHFSVQATASSMDVIYFWFSVISLIIRTFYMGLTVADVSEESKLPLKVFRAIPLVSWCPEV